MLADEMKVKEKEIARMEHVPVDSTQDLNFAHETMQNWMMRQTQTHNVDGIGSIAW